LASPSVDSASMLAQLGSSTDVEWLDSIAHGESRLHQAAVASNLATATHTLVHLSSSENVMIRNRVAGHPNTPLELVLSFLSGDAETEKGIRSAAARNSNLPLPTIDELSNSKDLAILQGVVRNPKASKELIAKVLDGLGDLETFDKVQVVEGALKNPNVPARFLEKYAKSDIEKLKILVASNINTPQKVLGELARDSSITVSTEACYNYSTSMFDAAKFFYDQLESGGILLDAEGEKVAAIEARADRELAALGYDESTLDSITFKMKLKVLSA